MRKRVLALLMILSMVIVPFQAAMATDDPQASPVVVPDTSTEEEATPSTPEGEDEADSPTQQSRSSVSALSTTPVTIQTIVPTNNGGDNFDIVITLFLEEGFERSNGETFSFSGSGYPWESTITFVDASLGSTSLPLEIVTTPAPALSNIGFVATSDLIVPAGGVTLELTLEVDVVFSYGCWVSASEYYPTAEFFGYVSVDGVDTFDVWSNPNLTSDIACPGLAAPFVDWMSFDAIDQMLYVDFVLPVPLVPGQSFTISYDAAKLAGPVEPFGLQMYNEQTDTMDTVAQVVASNGVLTFTVTRSGGEDAYDGWIYTAIPMTFVIACQEGQTSLEIGRLEFVALNDLEDYEDDLVRSTYVDIVLCDADPLTKTGAWMTDEEGRDYIQWTIDTGNLIPRAWVSDYAYDEGWMFEFDCSSLVIAPAEGTIVYQPWPDSCEDWAEIVLELDQSLDSEVDYVRAVITINAYPVDEPSSTTFVNCAYTGSTNNNEGEARAAAATGLGGEACFELFPKDGGDFITKDVDKAEVYSGETITYTVVAETTTDRWDYVEVIDELPEGFVIDESSITCSVEPVLFMATPCYELNDDGAGGKVLTARAIPNESDDSYEYSDAVKITLTFKGVVTAPAGSTIVNEACSSRQFDERMQPEMLRENMGDPTIIGGGVICDDAVTRVIAPPVTETPTPTATAPASPEASPTTTVEPTATTGVTGLPSTGTSGGSGHAFQFMAAALVASLVVAALGVRAAETRR